MTTRILISFTREVPKPVDDVQVACSYHQELRHTCPVQRGSSERGVVITEVITDLGDLHQALLTRTTNLVGVARALLHGNGGKEDSGDYEVVRITACRLRLDRLTSVLALSSIEVIDVRGAVREGAVLFGDGSSKILRDNFIDSERRRGPAATLDSTVKPALASVGARSGSELL